ncbi:methyltransferase domain-containing protein [Oscillatoria sp. FACHB-1407]|uniref:methyltransferase domain-containing protein n=1 Tax=Oscillatoria sp. FACHB-1407 TaxID=2692847 RepID=UPI0016868293|nr:methyltransferase domain-containing protein [Oscillatoria sp. FACHB-1407]MBD2464505.1 methyltransferase domain-containing protein [Oscillatoria sp. FACHB-1407]
MSEPSPISTPRSPHFWEERYQTGSTRWDLGQPAPPFVQLLQSADAPPPGRMAVLGSGKGHDALWFAKHGFEVVGFDFAPSAIAQSTALAEAQEISAQFLQRDIFELPHEFANQFDYVLEHTCFCAIPLELRSAYVHLVRDLLRPHGELIALFWLHDRPDGPPFGGRVDEIHQRFSPDFEILSLKNVTDSVANRQNEEYLGRLRVKKT